MAPTYKRLGELYEERGERDEAVRYYSEFVELWKDADAELQPQVERVMNEFALNPVWSSRGDLIIYAGKQVSGFSTLEAIRPDGTRVEIPEMRIWVGAESFRFLPDGSGLVFMRGWFSGQDYWLLDIDTMTSRQLTNLAKGASSRTFDISPDGKTIVFDRLRVKTEIVLIELSKDESAE